MQTLIFQTFNGIEKREVPKQSHGMGPLAMVPGRHCGVYVTWGTPASKPGRNQTLEPILVPCRLVLIQPYPWSTMKCSLLHPRSVRST